MSPKPAKDTTLETLVQPMPCIAFVVDGIEFQATVNVNVLTVPLDWKLKGRLENRIGHQLAALFEAQAETTS